MNKLVLASAALLLVSAATDAEAAILKGAAADSFIAKYFPKCRHPGARRRRICLYRQVGKASQGSCPV